MHTQSDCMRLKYSVNSSDQNMPVLQEPSLELLALAIN